MASHGPRMADPNGGEADESRSEVAIANSAAFANLTRTMDEMCDDIEPVLINRDEVQSVATVPLEDSGAHKETAGLLRSPANARRLLSAAAQLAAGRGVERELPP